MHIPPYVSEADADAAIMRITDRRLRIDDPHAERIPDDVVGVVAYLRKYSGGLPPAVAVADLEDAVVLRHRLYWVGEECELWIHEAAPRRGVSLSRIAKLLGLGHRQSAHDRRRLVRDKLTQATGRAAPVTRRERREDAAAATWLAEHRDEVLAVAAALHEQRELGDSDEAQDWLADVARDLAAGAVTLLSFHTLQFAALALAAAPALQEAPVGHPARVALARWTALYAGFRAAR